MHTDPLTGVYSRATLEKRLHEEVDRALRYELSFSIVLLDLDHYKSINDAFGHLRGDQILVELVARLKTTVRKSDILFRYGGDEFLVLLPNTPKDQAVILAERLQEIVHKDPFFGRPPVTVTLSLGVASCPEDGDTAEALFEKADQRHYEAKRRGRARVVSQEAEKPPLLPFDDDTRLIERDDALNTLHAFLREMPERNRGVLIVSGPQGSGRSRFINEVGKVARLQGYEVLPLRGSPALKNRSFGDLAEVCKNWEILPPPTVGAYEFAEALRRLVEEKGRTGLLITVDNLLETDWDTQDLLRHLVLSTHPPILVALAFSADLANARRVFPPLSTLENVVELAPLSFQGFSIWLRMILKWEAPEAFAAWLFRETHGLPGFVRRAVSDLVNQGLLEKVEEGWIFHADLQTFTIKDHLGLTKPPVHNLPSPPTGFLGREEEIETAKERLGSSRLLSITGPGGIGKTRLALQVAAELLEDYPDGVFWVPLAAVPSPDRIVGAIGDSLGLTFQTRPDPKTQLERNLLDKKLLLVLDNFEHLTEGSGIVADLLEKAPNLKVLATSREVLNLRGESRLPLSGMNFPIDIPVERAETFPAVQLFLQAARRTSPDFRLTDENKTPVIRICQIVEGLPLAIELAAAWIKVLSCQEIEREIEKNLDFLTTSLRDVPQRHRSLRAVFEHSWDLLLENEKKTLKQMAVFSGSFSREAAQMISGASLVEIAILLDKSLLRREGIERFELHEILRQYAEEKLQEQPDLRRATREMHAEYYASLVERQGNLLKTGRMKEALQLFGQEMKNLESAWLWAIEAGRTALVGAMLEGMFRYNRLRGFLEAEAALLTKAEKMLAKIEQHQGRLDKAQEDLLARIYSYQGEIFLYQSQYDLSRERLINSQEAFRRLGNLEQVAEVLHHLSTLENELGDYNLATGYARECLATFEGLGDRNGIASAYNLLGIIDYELGEYPRAEQQHRESLRLYRETDNPLGLISTLINLGNVESELGVYQQAAQMYREAMEISETIGATAMLAAILNNLGDVERELGNYLEAREYLHRALAIYSRTGEVYGRSVALSNLGIVAFHLGNLVESEKLLEESLEISEKAGIRLQSAYSFTQLGIVACERGQYEEAGKYFEQALCIAQENQAPPLILEILVAFAELKLCQKEIETACQLLQFALAHPATMKNHRIKAEALYTRIENENSGNVENEFLKPGKLPAIEDIVRGVLGVSCPSTL